MDDQPADNAVTEIHVDGWTVAQVIGPLDTGGWEQVIAHLDPHLTADTQIAVDVRRAAADPTAAVRACIDLARTASDRGCRLVIVTSSEQALRDLREAGIREVYESLDAALHVTTPVLRQAVTPDHRQPLVPAIGDALLVATEDALPDDGTTGAP